MVSAVRQDFRTGDLRVTYLAEDGSHCTEPFDMVVLSVGLERSSGAAELAATLGVRLDEYGFVCGQADNPVATSRDALTACGTSLGPKDIPDSVTEAAAAAATVGRSLAAARFSEVVTPEYPPERDVSAEPPRAGVFVCHCGNNIAGVVDVEGLAAFAATLPGVVHAERNLYVCSPQGIEMLRQAIETRSLNRVVVASCTPRTHAAIFQDAMMQAGLNKYLLEMANIRDQCSWVHGAHPAEATAKARYLLASAVAKVLCQRPLEERTQPVTRAGLVVGGGLAGMVAAANLAAQGYDVHLVERTGQLGGNLRHIRRTLDGLDVPVLMARLIREVEADPRIHVHLNSTLNRHRGTVGNFSSQVTTADGSRKDILHGVTVVATGAAMYEPDEYRQIAGPSPAAGLGPAGGAEVVTQRELERRLGLPAFDVPRDVVMIQCVGCRNEQRPYCSRVCCAEAVKNALELKERDPDCRVTVLYRDVRTFGLMEKYYLRARRAGVLFLRYEEAHPPDVRADGTVRLRDPVLGRELTLHASLVVLSAAVVPNEDNRALAEVLGVPLTTDRFFMEAHVKLRPVDFAREGIFVAGLAHWPKFIPETITQALAAAGRASAILSKEVVRAGGAISVVDRERCAACLTCVRACPFGVPRIEEGTAVIEPTACQGCGVCAAECPAEAVTLQYFDDEQMRAAVSGLFRKGRRNAEEAVKT
jgi:heterodisulfide reductase subunit A-like polyferredoxin